MNKYILIILLVFSVKFSSAQNYIPIPMDSAAWNVWWGCSHCANCYMDILTKPSGDTLINSVSYVKIMKYLINGGCAGCSFCDYTFGIGYQGAIRQDSTAHKVFIILPSDSTENILYDFLQNIGDTINSILSDICYPELVTGVDSVQIAGSYRRRILTSADGCNNSGNEFIEGIGSLKGLIETTHSFEVGSMLNCFSHNGQTIYPDSTVYCLNYVDIHESENFLRIIVSPNPFTDQFKIYFPYILSQVKISLYNSLGNKIMELNQKQVNEIKINRNNLPSGIYFYQLISENRIISTGKIIAE